MTPKSDTPPVDKGTISIINACMILVFAFGGGCAWKNVTDNQALVAAKEDSAEKKTELDAKIADQKAEQVLALLEEQKIILQDHSRILDEHGKKLDGVVEKTDAMRARSLAVYSDKWGVYCEYLAWEDFTNKNPSLRITKPDIYKIRQANPPLPMPSN